MLGVVVSCDGEEGGAVIWCEDHAELAYLKGRGSLRDAGERPKVGDLVQFRVAEKSGLRYARALRVLAPDAMPGLASDLAAAGPGVASRLRRVG